MTGIADHITNAELSLERAKDDKICQVTEMHLMMAQTEALIAIAKLLDDLIGTDAIIQIKDVDKYNY
jgi:hypothetical protein